MNITPIPKMAKTEKDILTDAKLDEYIESLVDKAQELAKSKGKVVYDINDLIEADKFENGGKELIIEIESATEDYEKVVERLDAHAEELHEISASYQDIINQRDKYDDTKIS